MKLKVTMVVELKDAGMMKLIEQVIIGIVAPKILKTTVDSELFDVSIVEVIKQ